MNHKLSLAEKKAITESRIMELLSEQISYNDAALSIVNEKVRIAIESIKIKKDEDIVSRKIKDVRKKLDSELARRKIEGECNE